MNKFNIRSGSFELSKTINLKEMRPKNFHKNIDKELYKINKIVTTKNGWSIVKKCPVCRKTSFTSWLEKYGNILKFCEKCTHGFSHRYPKKLSDAYENKNQIARTIKTYHKKRKYRIKRFATERIDLIKKFKKRGDLLDFGCGTGWFLEHAKKYYNITGYEPTKSLANMTSKLLKINVESNFLKLQDKKFDIITAFDVIEHVVDPKKIFSQFIKLLKKGGILLIYTPNSNSFSFKYMKKKQNLIIPPLHLHYFNKKSIYKLSQKSFPLVFYETSGLDIGDIYAHERDSGNNEFSRFLYKNYQVLQTFIDLNESGNHLRAIFRKN